MKSITPVSRAALALAALVPCSQALVQEVDDAARPVSRPAWADFDVDGLPDMLARGEAGGLSLLRKAR